jgi:hypothetical protein
MLKRFSMLFVLAFLISPVLSFGDQAATAEKPTTLPADGGEPGKAYMAYTKVLAAGDIENLKKAVTTVRAKELDDPQMKEMLPMIQALQPKELKILGGTMTSKDATLNVEGKGEGDTKQTGTIHMVLENKVWKVEKESWKSATN